MCRYIISRLFASMVLIVAASCSSNNSESGADSAVLTEIEPASFSDEGLPGAIYRIKGVDVTSGAEQLSLHQTEGKELQFENPEKNIWQARIPVDWWGESLQFELRDSSGKALASYRVKTAEHPTLTQFSGGHNHSCVLADGQPVCWGANDVHQYDVAERSSNPVAISAQNNFTCIQNGNDEINCSGIHDQYVDLRFESAQQIVPASYQHISSLDTLLSGNYYQESSTIIHRTSASLGGSEVKSDFFNTYFLCSVEQGEVICEGQSADTYRELTFGGFLGSQEVLRNDGVFEWSMLNGFVGAEISAFAAGSHAFCMIVDGQVLCKGLGSKPLPSESFGKDFINLPLAGLETPEFDSPEMLAMGGDNVCVVDQNGTQCWGVQSGSAITVPAHIIAPSSISVGSQHFCAIVDGKPACWGDFCIYNKYNEIDGTYFNYSCFDDAGLVSHEGAESFVKIISGEAYSCGLSTAGTVECWGKYCEFPEGDIFDFGVAERKCVDASSLVPNMNTMGARLSEIKNQNITHDKELTIRSYGLPNATYSAKSSSLEIVDADIDSVSGKLILKVGESRGTAYVTVQVASGRFYLERRFRVNVIASL